MDGEAKPTAETAKTIRAINTDTVHKICSGQVSISSKNRIIVK